ncbi:MFS transporter [Pseudooceanicola sp. CBS1P-1]|uniref:MFS transporter n=1 Tax=Pseudooceanicola albus TaxID=2692189 RepID=A0A6L7FY75_9RHOB|nr:MULTISPECIES: MFS transporter [Pseudooceanicola]MBT9383412.1 MFS transporter [Pseudooceanicola endophyticus]MXN16266.1 MFS transporter [Pseudooceanicola albus]
MPLTLTHSPARHRAGFAIVLAGSALMMASASAPSPFYPMLQSQMGFSAFVMSGIFAIYAIVLLIKLLVLGSISDHVGRRPVLSLGFALLALSSIGFDLSGTVGQLFLARAVQGVACGLLLSTLSATITDLEPPEFPGLAAICNSVIPLVGLAIGALASGFAMDLLEAPKADIFHAIAVLSLILLVATWALPETSPRHEGLWQALKPQVGLPGPVKAPFWKGAPALFAGWATGGLYLSLGASIVSHVFQIHSVVVQGLVVTLLSGMGALACFLARKHSARNVVLFGTTALALGTLVTLLGVHLQILWLYLVALAVVGTGFGTCFYGFIRSIVPLTPAEVRGEMFAALFCVSYLAFGVPVVIAGLLVPMLGLEKTVICYGLLIAAMAALAGVLRRFSAQA